MEQMKKSYTSTEQITARCGMYRLLSRLWIRELDLELLRALCSPPLRDLFTAAGGKTPDGDDEAVKEQLAMDYCRLFVGPANHLPPFQAVWQTGQFQGKTTVSMSSFVDVVGYNTQLLPAGMMLDHLGVQLDVMGHILGQALIRQSKEDGLDEVLEVSDAFFARHLQWPTRLLQTAIPRATTDFYRSLIQVTRDFLQSES